MILVARYPTPDLQRFSYISVQCGEQIEIGILDAYIYLVIKHQSRVFPAFLNGYGNSGEPLPAFVVVGNLRDRLGLIIRH